MKRRLLFVLPVVAATVAACTTEVKEERQFVNLSQGVCSFHGEGNEPLAIEVKTSPTEWTVESGASWVTAERTDDRTLTVTVADNNMDAERSATVTVAAGQAVQYIKVVQLAPDSEFATYRRLETMNSGMMSPGGKYLGGFITGRDEETGGYDHTVRFIDLDTGEVKDVGPYPNSLYYLQQVIAVSDQGIVFCVTGTGECLMIDMEGEVVPVPKIPGYNRGWPRVSRTSSDGRYWAGYVGDDSAVYHPVLWTDGVPEILPMPEKNFRGYDFFNGIMARGISADGSIIYGSTWENDDFGMVYWKKEGGEWKVAYAGEDVHRIHPEILEDGEFKRNYTCADGLIVHARMTCASPNGRWLASTYRTETLNEEGTGIVKEQWPAFYNTETGTTTILEEVPGGAGYCVTDDGIAFVSSNVTAGVYDLNTETYLGTIPEWVHNNYGIPIPANGWIEYISPDGRLHGKYVVEDALRGAIALMWYVVPLQ